MLDTLLNWVLRGVVLLFGAGALLAIVRWLAAAARERRERWAVRIAAGMIVLAVIYAAGHARLLLSREQLEEGRMRYARFGDPRLAELNRGELRGWILDCTGEDAQALARYGVRDGEVTRVYPLGEGGANLIGGGQDAADRDYTVERLYAERLREPRNLRESGELHPVGTDMQLTLCLGPTREAWRLLAQTGLPGAVVVQDVSNGALVAYAATGTATTAPYGIKRYAIPGSVFKLALAALWWESGLPDQKMPCPSEIQVTPRRAVRNFESHAYPSLEVPREMLVVSCNTQAISMAMIMRQRLGPEAFVDAFRRYGFAPYSSDAPDAERDFWNTGNERWARRMTPPPARVKLRERYDAFEFAQVAIGQGPVDVTPIAVSRFLQAIGNGGRMLPVTMEADRLDDLPEPRQIMQPATTQKLMGAMLGVVDEGTGVRAKPIVDGTGWDLGGKTGTADVRAGQRPDAWFAGLMFGPDARPKYTVVVYVENGGQGGQRAAPIAGAMTRFMAGWTTQRAAAATRTRTAMAEGGR